MRRICNKNACRSKALFPAMMDRARSRVAVQQHNFRAMRSLLYVYSCSILASRYAFTCSSWKKQQLRSAVHGSFYQLGYVMSSCSKKVVDFSKKVKLQVVVESTIYYFFNLLAQMSLNSEKSDHFKRKFQISGIMGRGSVVMVYTKPIPVLLAKILSFVLISLLCSFQFWYCASTTTVAQARKMLSKLA